MNRALARLALRRSLPPGFALAGLALAVLCVSAAWRPEPLIAAALAATCDPSIAQSALARQGVWTALLVVLAPFLVARAAGTVAGWRRGEIESLAASGAGRLPIALSTWLGQSGAALVFVLACAVAAELAATSAGPGRALAARYATTALVLLESDQPLARSLEVATTPPGALLRAHLAFLGGGPSARVRLALRRGGDDARGTEIQALVSTPSALDVPLPEGEGRLELVLERLDGDAVVALEQDGLELLVPVASRRLTGACLALRVWLALATTLALALGFGAWLSAPTAFLAVLASLVPTWLSGQAWAAFLPWRGVAQALALAGEDVTAPLPSPRAWIATSLAAGLGLTLAVTGLRPWRRAT